MDMKTFCSATLVAFRGKTYYVVDVDNKFYENGAVRLLPKDGGGSVVVCPDDAEWTELVVLEPSKAITA